MIGFVMISGIDSILEVATSCRGGKMSKIKSDLTDTIRFITVNAGMNVK